MIIIDLNKFSLPKSKTLSGIVKESGYRNTLLADYQFETICNAIAEFEKELDNNHEIALKLTSFGQSVLLNVTKLSYSNPSIIQFYGYVDGNYAELIQHVTQLNFLIMAVEKDDPSRKPRRIGFIQSD